MFYVKLIPYSKDKITSKKVDEDKIVVHLKKIILLAPHKITLRSQARTGDDHHPVVDETVDLTYSYKKHGFVVPHDSLCHVSHCISS